MKLRARLVVAFSLVALLSAAMAFAAVERFDRLLDREIEARRSALAEAVKATVQEELRAIDRALAAAANGLPRSRIPERWAPERAAALRLDVLGVVEGGVLASSAHLPIAVGDPPPRFIPTGAAAGYAAPFVDANPPAPRPALVGVRPTDGARIVFGGRALDERLLGRIARVGGSRVELWVDGRRLAAFPRAAEGPATEPPSPVVLPALPGTASDARIEVALDASRLRAAAAEAKLFTRVGAALGLLAALGLGMWQSSRLARPILDLAAAVDRVGAGELGVRVEGEGQDEVGHLVRGFNRMSEDLRRARARAARAEREAAWREFARHLAHEIKNPLSPMRLGMENLRKAWKKQHPQLDEILDESTRSVLDEVRALDRLVGTFSSLARLPSPEPRPTHPLALLAQVVRLYELPSPELGPELPLVLADPDAIHQALVNLVKNAREALGASGPIRVGARADRRDGEPGVWLEVVDRGPGMPPEVAARATRAAFTTKATGSGLGLAIVTRTVEAHGGAFALDSTPGEGTRASIWLPAAGGKLGT